ncbi:MAG: GDP-L-fucose synthase family protein [Bacteroidota bacterium]
MHQNSKIYLAGHRGLVGSAIHSKLIQQGYTNIITRPSRELDLKDQRAVAQFFEQEKPEYVILAAAKVGGIMANNTYRAEFLYDNLQIQNNVIHQSYLHGVKKLLFLGSSCIYPRNCPQPMKEEYLLTDELEYTNEPYAIAKITGMKMCEEYNIQYGTNFISVMPTNLYGPNDNYDLETSHVLPALIRKMHLAKCLEQDDWDSLRKDLNHLPINSIDGQSDQQKIIQTLEHQGISFANQPISQSTNRSGASSPHRSVAVKLWGSGTPRREFLHSDDMADACVYLMENTDFADLAGYSIPEDHLNQKAHNLLTLAKEQHQTIIQSNDQTANHSDNPYLSLVKDHQVSIKNTHLNIGTGKDISIKELAEMIKEIVGFQGTIGWNTNMPDGTYRKLQDVSKLHEMGWQEKIGLREGIRKVYGQYLDGTKKTI